ncbi:hypothetical protein [Thermaerobacter subterraneus]|uniref:Uncharacterized protein n=1 Tax=Thermaerobacter subterraneus DSM 13965 TaxID=867903 RepID=K6PS04_9FIRM|nr:hypothetical protein [Thermaerobacter subterraneus]EKP95737.1 hypothetical protein ThesuDRAFT_01496 [Thermaerobacter subterraneus DSM 13965]
MDDRERNRPEPERVGGSDAAGGPGQAKSAGAAPRGEGRPQAGDPGAAGPAGSEAGRAGSSGRGHAGQGADAGATPPAGPGATGPAAGPSDPEALMDLYYEVSMEGVDLEQFLQRLDAGEWGPVEPEVVADFLRDLEAVILSNIEVKAMEGPHYAGRRLEVIEETQRQFEELIARYLSRGPGV